MNKKQQKKVQGEGDYEAAARYGKDVADFVAKNPGSKAALIAKPRSAAEAKALVQAETIGRARSRGEDKHDAMKDKK